MIGEVTEHIKENNGKNIQFLILQKKKTSIKKYNEIWEGIKTKLKT